MSNGRNRKIRLVFASDKSKLLSSTFEILAANYLHSLSSRGSKAYIQSQKSLLDNYFSSFYPLLCSQLNGAIFHQGIDLAMQKGANPNTLTSLFYLVNRLIKFGEENNFLPLGKIPRFTIPKIKESSPPLLRMDDAISLLKELQNPKDYCFCALLLTTPILFQELVVLRIQDVDFYQGKILVSACFHPTQGKKMPYQERPKLRYVDMTPLTRNVLKLYFRYLSLERQKKNYKNPFGLLFPNRDGNYLSRYCFEGKMRRVLSSEGLAMPGPLTCRLFALSLYVQKENNITYIQRQFGFRNYSETRKFIALVEPLSSSQFEEYLRKIHLEGAKE